MLGFYHHYINNKDNEVWGFNFSFGKKYDLGEAFNAFWFKIFKGLSLTIWPNRRWGMFYIEIYRMNNNPHYGKGFSISLGIGLFQKWTRLSFRSWEFQK